MKKKKRQEFVVSRFLQRFVSREDFLCISQFMLKKTAKSARRYGKFFRACSFYIACRIYDSSCLWSVCIFSSEWNQYYHLSKGKKRLTGIWVDFAATQLIGCADTLEKAGISELSEYTKRLKDCKKALGSFRKGSFLVVNHDGMETGPEAVMLDYIRMMTHIRCCRERDNERLLTLAIRTSQAATVPRIAKVKPLPCIKVRSTSYSKNLPTRITRNDSA